MFISAQTRALLLLTADLGGEAPLDMAAFDRLAGWLRKRGLQPADLMLDGAAGHLAGRPAGTVPTMRVLSLLAREAALTAALEDWQKSGLWVLGRGDPDYPRRLKRRLRGAAPALLFGCGDRALLNRGGLAVVGGDGAGAESAGFAAGFGTAAAASGFITISGGAGAIEAAALRAGLSRGGGAIAVLPDRLGQEARSDRLRRPAMDGLLVLVSAALPECEAAGASRQAADDCLYGLADAALLVAVGRADARWAGVIAASERGWVPLWTRRADPEAGELARLGVGLLPDGPVSPRTLLDPPAADGRIGARPSPSQPMGAMPLVFMTPVPGPSLVGFAEERAPFEGDGDLTSVAPRPEPGATSIATVTVPAGAAGAGERGAHLRLVASAAAARPEAAARAALAEPGLYDIFVQRVAALLADEALGAWRIADMLDLTEQQVETWLRRAEAAGRVSLDPVTRLYCNDTAT